jgi:dolichol-phosphate mannosyltransferase
MKTGGPSVSNPLSLLSVVIPARNEECCIASTIGHLHLELELHDVPHEIVVVDDGSTDSTGLEERFFAGWMRPRETPS